MALAEIDDTCSLCSKYYEDPVVIECGDSFCRSCITQFWKNERKRTCPKCKEDIEDNELRSNSHLAKLAKMCKEMDTIHYKLAKCTRCEKHKRPLFHFCKTDQRFICKVCKGEEHESHDVEHSMSVVYNHMIDVQEHLEPLKWHLEDLLYCKSRQEKDCEDLKKNIEAQRIKILSEFEEINQLLNREKHVLLKRLDMTEKMITQKLGENVSRLQNECTSLDKIITEIDEKLNESPVNLVKNVQRLLKRCDSVTLLEPHRERAECNQNFYSAPRQFMVLKEILKAFQVVPANITLNKKSANCNLQVSSDKKSVKWTKEKKPTPRNAGFNKSKGEQRFDTLPCVLGSPGFSSGRHYWEVQVDVTGDWAIGIAKYWVSRIGRVRLSASGGIWAIRHNIGQYFVLSTPPIRLTLSERPRKIRLYLDMEIRQLSIYNADSKEHIYTFDLSSSKSFLPFFWTMCEKEIRLL
ncbi:hypothetical protein GDO86_012632 [Hymenochirus boettgeri]|uniref:Uncharacterized protein n=1 Tax=Hymenochirus boettgeri TaxID=247094 RepID=A0A8T2IMZ4_9PIPI|nr:hypothetical protein GDO86_012632 [Hymenochirus boettgeri]KAG8434326.1 hypothetical protein GDO86_012632 [Hymenochirus boettgeri]KAG8434327.1 hypothetical protein GDO86_012632 [Hymenochirus boettgeri]